MPRTNNTDVDEILDTTLDPSVLDAYIDAASDIVDDIAGTNSGLSASRLERIEKFLAAHLATAQDPRASSQSGESRSISYEDRGSDATANYLEVAKSLDTTGIIADLNKRTATLDVPDARNIVE